MNNILSGTSYFPLQQYLPDSLLYIHYNNAGGSMVKNAWLKTKEKRPESKSSLMDHHQVSCHRPSFPCELSRTIISFRSKEYSRCIRNRKTSRCKLMAVSLCRNSLVEYNICLFVLQPVLEAQIARVKVGRPLIVKLAPALALRISHQRYVMSATHGRSNMA